MEDQEKRIIKPLSGIELTEESHPIYPDSEEAVKLGFTSDKFSGYLWKDHDSIYLSLVISVDEGKGNVRRLIETLKEKYPVIKVGSVVSARMADILDLQGFKEELHEDELGESIELIWRRDSNSK